MRSSVYGICAALLLAPAALAQDAGAARLEAELTAAPSATQFLTDKCAALKLASPPLIRAVRQSADVPASPEVRAALKVSADTPLRYRRVNLTCGSHVLSQADNWYVPSRLSDDMNKTLDTTDTSFGTVVKPLNFHRQTLKMESGTMEPGDSAHLFRVTAVLLTPDEVPFSLVVENYARELASPAQP
jgi:hypothetical protein